MQMEMNLSAVRISWEVEMGTNRWRTTKMLINRSVLAKNFLKRWSWKLKKEKWKRILISRFPLCFALQFFSIHSWRNFRSDPKNNLNLVFMFLNLFSSFYSAFNLSLPLFFLLPFQIMCLVPIGRVHGMRHVTNIEVSLNSQKGSLMLSSIKNLINQRLTKIIFFDVIYKLSSFNSFDEITICLLFLFFNLFKHFPARMKKIVFDECSEDF